MRAMMGYTTATEIGDSIVGGYSDGTATNRATTSEDMNQHQSLSNISHFTNKTAHCKNTDFGIMTDLKIKTYEKKYSIY